MAGALPKRKLFQLNIYSKSEILTYTDELTLGHKPMRPSKQEHFWIMALTE